MSKSYLMFGIVILIICSGLSGCTEENNTDKTEEDFKDKEPQELILGTWKCKSADIWYRFKSDGTFESSGDDDEFQWLTQKDMWYTIDDKIHINYYDWYQQSEIFTLSYVVYKLDIPLILNYGLNLIFIGVVVYYKVKPRKIYEKK